MPNMMNANVRDPRSAAAEVSLDLSRTDAAIHRQLRARWPLDPHMWWELDHDGKSGWVYSAQNKILARLIHKKA